MWSRFERRLCRRNRFWGEASEGGRSPSPSVLETGQGLADAGRLIESSQGFEESQSALQKLPRSGEITRAPAQ